ncbi:MAG: hydroxylamine reductase [Bacillota bacterium]
MFCNQCSQTPPAGCTKAGVCGKNEDLVSVQDILLLGLKGVAAYAYHARELGYSDPEIDGFMHEALFSTLTNVDFDLPRTVRMVLRCGEVNLKAMELLDRAHTERFGVPQPTAVSRGTRKGHGILVTGHDLLDLYELLKQTAGTGINVYTHGEMLPAHAYPVLRQFSHLAGNWGDSWVRQKDEFEAFPGAVLATTNCVLIPKESYRDRLFTCGIAGVEGVVHIENRDFTPVIEKALSLPKLTASEGGKVTTGFHHQAVLALADKVIEGVKSGKIRRFFLVGGCDGPHKAMPYYREFVRMVPGDCVVLTLGCGKYRFNDLDLGAIDGIPRLLDIGQCNNSYSAVQIAAALAGAFRTSVNELPLSLVLSWFEQKAVAILLSLFYLGVKGIYLGPRPPAFVTPGILRVLQENFDLRLITTPAEDLAAMLG